MNRMPGKPIGLEEAVQRPLGETSNVARAQPERSPSEVNVRGDTAGFNQCIAQTRVAILAGVLKQVVDVAKQESGFSNFDLAELTESLWCRESSRRAGRL